MAAAAEPYKPRMIDFENILFGPSSIKLLSLGSLNVLFVEDAHIPPIEETCGDYSDETKWIDYVLDKLFKKVNFPVNFFLETTSFYKSYLGEFKEEYLFNENEGLSKLMNLFRNCVHITEKECGYLDTPVFFNNMETRRFEASKKYSFNTGKLSFKKVAFDGERDTLFDLPKIYLNRVIQDILDKTTYYNVIGQLNHQEIQESVSMFLDELKYLTNDLELHIIQRMFEKYDRYFKYTKRDDKAKDNLKKILKMFHLLNDVEKLKSLFSNLLCNQKSDDNFNTFKSMFYMFDETEKIVGDRINPHAKFSKQLKTEIYDEDIKQKILEYIDLLCNKPEFKENIKIAIKICEKLITIIFEERQNSLKIITIILLMRKIDTIFLNINALVFDTYNIARFMRMYPFDESEFEFAIVYAGRFHTTNMIDFLTTYYNGRIIASINTDSDVNACIKFNTEQNIEFVRILDKILIELQSKDMIRRNFFFFNKKIPFSEDVRLESIKEEIRELKKSREMGSKPRLEEMIKFHKYLSYHYRKNKRLEKYSEKQVVPLLSYDESEAPQLIVSSKPLTLAKPSTPVKLTPKKQEELLDFLVDSSSNELTEEDLSNLPGSVNSGGYKYNTSLYFNHCF